MSELLSYQHRHGDELVTISWAPQYADDGGHLSKSHRFTLITEHEGQGLSPETVTRHLEDLGDRLVRAFLPAFKAIHVGTIAFPTRHDHIFYAKKPWLMKRRMNAFFDNIETRDTDVPIEIAITDAAEPEWDSYCDFLVPDYDAIASESANSLNVTIGEPITMSGPEFLAMMQAQADAAGPSPEDGLIPISIELSGSVMPVERGVRYEDPLLEALPDAKVVGGGTMMHEVDGEQQIKSCHIEMRIPDSPDAIETVREILRKAAAPEGSTVTRLTDDMVFPV